jgi:hypothetical protein
MCGVITTAGWVDSSAGTDGSSSNTSSPAPPRCPACRDATSAVVSTRPPRLTLINRAPVRISASSRAPIRCRVRAVSGACRMTMSQEPSNSSSARTDAPPVSAGGCGSLIATRAPSAVSWPRSPDDPAETDHAARQGRACAAGRLPFTGRPPRSAATSLVSRPAPVRPHGRTPPRRKVGDVGDQHTTLGRRGDYDVVQTDAHPSAIRRPTAFSITAADTGAQQVRIAAGWCSAASLDRRRPVRFRGPATGAGLRPRAPRVRCCHRPRPVGERTTGAVSVPGCRSRVVGPGVVGHGLLCSVLLWRAAHRVVWRSGDALADAAQALCTEPETQAPTSSRPKEASGWPKPAGDPVHRTSRLQFGVLGQVGDLSVDAEEHVGAGVVLHDRTVEDSLRLSGRIGNLPGRPSHQAQRQRYILALQPIASGPEDQRGTRERW